MFKPVAVLMNASRRPVEAIETVIALTFFILGLYIISPLYVTTSTSAISMAFGSDYVQRAFVALTFYIIPALPVLLAWFVPRFNTLWWRSRATSWMFMGALFITILRLVTIGWVPLTWLFTLSLSFIVGICHLYIKSGDGLG